MTNQKLAGTFRLIEKDDQKLLVHCFGALADSKITQADVDHICRFYNTQPTERWLLEKDRSRDYSLYLTIYREESQ